MKIWIFLLFFCFCLKVLALPEKVCQDSVDVLLSSSYQNRFLVDDFLSDTFEELKDIIYANKIIITNNEINYILNQQGYEARNPITSEVFEIGSVFGIKISDLLKYTGNLKNHIDLSNVKVEESLFTLEKKRQVFKWAHFYLSDSITDILHKKNISMEKLSDKTGIEARFFRGIVNGMALPRFPLLLETLVKLDVDVVKFFKRVEENLEQGETLSSQKRDGEAL